MPIYEYKCRACGHQLEAIQKISDPPLTLCPTCQKDQLEKLISASSFQLKGTGWYATDYRDKGKPVKTEDKTENDNKENKDKKTPDKKDASPSSSSSSSSNSAEST